MKGEKEYFRKKVFGGFNRDDVIKYIARIADERNEAIAAKEKAQKDAKALADEIKQLREQLNKPAPFFPEFKQEEEPAPVEEPTPVEEPAPEEEPVPEEESTPEEEPVPEEKPEPDEEPTPEQTEPGGTGFEFPVLPDLAPAVIPAENQETQESSPEIPEAPYKPVNETEQPNKTTTRVKIKRRK